MSISLVQVSCQKVAPSQQKLSDLQKNGLQLASVGQGRDVVLAIDLTESVGLNDEGRLRLKQIIQDSLQKGDSVYVVPFASQVNPLQLQKFTNWCYSFPIRGNYTG